MFRKILFWSHLCSGIAVGIVVFTMSFTGVLLTYQRQIEQWVAQRDYVPAGEQGARLPLEELIRIQRSAYPDSPAASLSISNDPGAPVEFRAGRQGGVSLNPYTGARMELGSPGLSGFFSAVTGFHRWFNISGENRALARQVTGVSNVAFLFLLLSGMYLWLPKLWRWAQFKARLLLRGSYPDGKARDFHWHHIFGIWSALPLLAVVYTGAVISYPWAANFMYRVFGAEMAPVAALAADVAATNTAPAAAGLPLDALVQKALAHSGEGWKRVNLSLPRAEDDAVRIEIDKGNGAQAQLRHTLVLARCSGELKQTISFADTPEAQRLRGIARFLHTGEVLGFWGQTLAGLVSFSSLLLVWTGFALAWRRLVVPLYRKNKAE